jgi:hypothetical protein
MITSSDFNFYTIPDFTHHYDPRVSGNPWNLLHIPILAMMPSALHVFQGSVSTIDCCAFHFGFILGLPGQVWGQGKVRQTRYKILNPNATLAYFLLLLECIEH